MPDAKATDPQVRPIATPLLGRRDLLSVTVPSVGYDQIIDID